MEDLMPIAQPSPFHHFRSFSFDGMEVRTELLDGNPWFVVNDICNILGYLNPYDVIRKHIDPQDLSKREGLGKDGKIRKLNWTNESGLYSLILSSQLTSAKRLKRWVTSEVLPALRKTGEYKIKNVVNVQPKSVVEVRQTKRKAKEIQNEDDMTIEVYAGPTTVANVGVAVPEWSKIPEKIIQQTFAPWGWKWLIVNGMPCWPICDIAIMTDTDTALVKSQVEKLKDGLKASRDYIQLEEKYAAKIGMFGEQLLITCFGLPLVVQSLLNYKDRIGKYDAKLEALGFKKTKKLIAMTVETFQRDI